jgi:hypothetical protein
VGITKIRTPSTPTLGVFISIMPYSWGITLHIMHWNNNNYVIFLMCIKKSFLLTPHNCFDPIKFHDDINFEGGWGGGGGRVNFLTKKLKFSTSTHTLACSLQ